ncbi:ubiquinol-cytochrome c reductase iron-sulfur subunit [Frigoribacterium sp. CG_9.8]|uniref:QcrA and Rieske domain-containing protein n=1 Tax=Frigoribacterium sp. CG_9.8 TaxID=2787733 RepID=UPI0018C9A0AF|nr:Rieske (2Fe-2S) protein [Frigoribacterium sp. CG_9.8]MBG6107174.1 nitrite reductase/ring-hydroxylating ferredoxin subunit [Frigoribacterium sp. CG_9.8]
MTVPTPLTRRALISAGSATIAGAGVLALAACSSPATGGSGDGSGSAPSAPTAATGTEVIKLSDIPVGGSKVSKIGDVPVVLAQPTAGNVVCFNAVCPHQGCAVGAAGKQYACPCHGSRFNAETGAVINGPAVTGLTPIKVKVSGDAVVTV